MSISCDNQTSDWQLEILMEKLRSKAVQMKSLAEISKNVRMSLLEKRYALDSVEKSQHQKCLDTLQHSIKVTSLQSMVERLESLTRQLGLRFTVESSGVFIFSDMFYLEIVLESTGSVTDVKIHHEGKAEAQSCVELVNCLKRCDFTDFTSQLEGFVSIYELNAEKKIKSKAFTALESLEADLNTLAQLQFYQEPFNLVHKSTVGILEKRRGGHPMKLIYFVSPYELLSIEKNDLEPLSVENVLKKNLGCSVTVRMEGSAAHKLQTAMLVTVNRSSMNGKSSASYTPLSNQNSAVIPACFILKLNKPMPMCLSLVRRIQQIQPWSDTDSSISQPLLNLIVSHTSDGKLSCANNKGLFVTLPDHNQCYFMTENKSMNGIFVSSIPFTHPAHVASILTILREQALFNIIIGSCVRANSRQDFDNMTMFEISALSSTKISVSLEHPMEESMATADIDLSDISNLVCRIHNPGTPPPTNSPDPVSEMATKILNKSFSIPITLRAVVKMWEKQSSRRTLYLGHENFNLPLGSVDPGGHKGSDNGNGLSEFGNVQDKIKQEPGTHGQGQGNHHSVIGQEQQGMWLSTNFQQHFQTNEGSLTSMEMSNILYDPSEKSKNVKRKASEDLWKNPKRRIGSVDDLELAESSSCDSTSRSTLLSQETEIATPLSGAHSDSEMSNEAVNLEKSNLTESENLSLSREERSKTPASISEEKTLGESSNLSITPIPSVGTTFGSGTKPEKRPGVEIIPLVSAASLLPSSITITAITSPIKSSDDRKDKKSSSSSSSRSKEDKNRIDKDKKRKKKRDESPMGPPKQDPLSRPVSVSIKPSENVSFSTNPTPTSPSMMQRFSPSPTSSRSPSLPKHKPSSSHLSPVHISSSPKYSMTGGSSPSMSPKHSSSGVTGKPSMSTLKNAASSPSSKGSSDKPKSSKDGGSSRDKDKSRSLFGSTNVKPKPSSVRVKSDCEGSQDSTGSSPNNDSKSNSKGNRKGSLSAIVDKLKVNAQNCDFATDLSSKSNPNNINKVSKDPKGGAKSGEGKSSEYMVKPSSDGMKLTINKTRTKESKSFTSGGGNNNVFNAGTNVNKLNTGSPKIHTGLKPGVNSGPASKKPQQIQKSSSTSSVPTSGTFNSTSVKSSSSSSSKSSNPTNLSKSASKSSSSLPKSTSGDLNRIKDKSKPKMSSEKSIFSSIKGKSSPTPNDLDGMFKVQTKDLFPSPLAMEGMMKALDKNFQIPKLSARSSEDKKKVDPNNINKNSIDSKIFDIASKNDLSITKYPLAVPNVSIEQKIRNNMSMSSTKDSESKNNSFSSEKTIDLTTKFSSHHSINVKKDDDVLDFSKIPAFSHAASMSVKVIEAPGAMNSVNTRSVPENSPLTPDDEFTEESIVGK